MNATAVLTLIGLAVKYGPTIVRLAQAAGPIARALREAAPDLADPLQDLAKQAFPDRPLEEGLKRACSVIAEANVTRRINEERGGD